MKPKTQKQLALILIVVAGFSFLAYARPFFQLSSFLTQNISTRTDADVSVAAALPDSNLEGGLSSAVDGTHVYTGRNYYFQGSIWGMLHFPYPAIPSGYAFTSATINLYALTGCPLGIPGGCSLGVYVGMAPWSETGVTWNNARVTQCPIPTPGTCNPFIQVAGTGNAYAGVSIDVSSYVGAWYSGAAASWFSVVPGVTTTNGGYGFAVILLCSCGTGPGAYQAYTTWWDRNSGQPTSAATMTFTFTQLPQSPIAVISYTPSQPTTVTPVFFNATQSQSVNPGGFIASYAWTFGDGKTSTQSKVYHSYPASGSYSIGLSVVDNYGQTGTSTLTLQVKGVVLANFTLSPKSPHSGDVVTFNATNTVGVVTLYAWQFGDGQTANVTTPVTTHVFSYIGLFYVLLVANDAQGNKGIANYPLQVTSSCVNNSCGGGGGGGGFDDFVKNWQAYAPTLVLIGAAVLIPLLAVGIALALRRRNND